MSLITPLEDQVASRDRLPAAHLELSKVQDKGAQEMANGTAAITMPRVLGFLTVRLGV